MAVARFFSDDNAIPCISLLDVKRSRMWHISDLRVPGIEVCHPPLPYFSVVLHVYIS